MITRTTALPENAANLLRIFFPTIADLLTVNETAIEPPQEEGNHMNSPRNLALEATFINHNFSQQCLKMVPKGKVNTTFIWYLGLDMKEILFTVTDWPFQNCTLLLFDCLLLQFLCSWRTFLFIGSFSGQFSFFFMHLYISKRVKFPSWHQHNWGKELLKFSHFSGGGGEVRVGHVCPGMFA